MKLKSKYMRIVTCVMCTALAVRRTILPLTLTVKREKFFSNLLITFRKFFCVSNVKCKNM